MLYEEGMIDQSTYSTICLHHDTGRNVAGLKYKGLNIKNTTVLFPDTVVATRGLERRDVGTVFNLFSSA